MLKIIRADEKVRIQYNCQTDKGNKWEIYFENERTSKFNAALLEDKISNDFHDFIKKIRQEAYNEGWKDKSSKKVPKRTHFHGYIF